MISSPADLAEVAGLQSQFGLDVERIFLMPEGRDPKTLQGRREWLAEKCRALGYRFSDRLHIQLWGDERGR